MAVLYRKLQAGTTVAAFLGAGIIVVANLMYAYGLVGPLLPLMVVLAAALIVMSALVVEVGEEAVIARFRLGFPRRTIPLDRIVSHRATAMPWYFGWGVRWIPRGWMFRVAGLGVVEVEIEGGRRFCIGSPEPEALAEAISRARGGAHGR